MVKATLIKPEREETSIMGRKIAYRSFPVGILKVVYVLERKAHVVISTIWHKRNL